MSEAPRRLADADLLRIAVAKAFYHLSYSYWAMRSRRPRPPTRPAEITDLRLESGLLLWFDTLYAVNFGAHSFPANHSRASGPRAANWSGLPGQNRGYGDGHVAWIPRQDLAIERLVAFDQSLPGGGGSGTFTWY